MPPGYVRPRRPGDIVGGMDDSPAREVTGLIRRWSGQAVRVLDGRGRAAEEAARAAAELVAKTVTVDSGTGAAWRVLPVDDRVLRAAGEIVRHRWLTPIEPGHARLLGELAGPAATAAREAWAADGWRRFFARPSARAGADRAMAYLRDVVDRVRASGLHGVLDTLEREACAGVPRMVPTDLGHPDVGVVGVLYDAAPDGHSAPELVSGADVAALPAALDALTGALAAERAARQSAVAAGERLRESSTDRLLDGLDVAALRDVTRDRLRIGPVADAGLRTVGAVLRAGAAVDDVPGIGPGSARKLLGAARTLRRRTLDDQPIVLSPDDRSPEATGLVRALRHWEDARRPLSGPGGSAGALALAALAPAMAHGTADLLVGCAPGTTVTQFRAALAGVRRVSGDMRGTFLRVVPGPGDPGGDPWEDFLSRPADYQALAAQLGLLGDDGERAHGDLPAEIVAAVRDADLDTGHLRASLRGYQDFAARFCLVQEKVLIGDEMGLGKTVEALAVLAHLRAEGAERFLVVCPAAVVTNWIREIESKTRLDARRLHGAARDLALDEWLTFGGVGVTTYGTLGSVLDRITDAPGLACVVVDEAHYVKNPEAKRSRMVADLIAGVDRAILLTGTALENRVDEFRTLVRHLRPDLDDVGDAVTAAEFRDRVAPVYLRRNQADVLDELPELVEVDDWVEPTAADSAAYREAVAEGNFMAMRRAGFAAGAGSAKMERLLDIVGQARDHGRRVIVFSHFLAVLEAVMAALGDVAVGPLTGGVPAPRRQELVDEFSRAAGGAVLVSQIIAGGTGLNIQAASVVVICEPQLKPTTEWQAIARAHRMGQLESVQVHRLLLEDSADARIQEILARKKRLFDELVRVSATADAAPEAHDISEAELAREIIAAERERLAVAPDPS